jgi:hypothetical protein
MNNNQNDEAIKAFQKLKSPYASFYQAMVSPSLFLLKYCLLINMCLDL